MHKYRRREKPHIIALYSGTTPLKIKDVKRGPVYFDKNQSILTFHCMS